MVVLLQCPLFFFFNDTATTEIYTLSLHDALPISSSPRRSRRSRRASAWRRSRSRPRSEEHTSELQSRGLNSYAVFCLKKKKDSRDVDAASDTSVGVVAGRLLSDP